MNDTLVCIELPGQVQPALEAVRRRGISNYSLLALTPHTEYTLDKMGQAYKRPEDYHSEDDINVVGLEDMATLEQFCDAADGYLQDRWALLKEHGIEPARMNWYFLKDLFNSVSIRAFIFRRILESEGPNQILYFGTRPEPIPRELFFVHESVWSRVIPVASGALGIPCDAIGEGTDPAVLNVRPDARRRPLKAQLIDLGRQVLGPKGVHLLRDGLNTIRLAAQAGLSVFPRDRRTSLPTVLALNDGYSLGHLLRHIKAKGVFNILFWDIRRSRPPVYLNSLSVPKVSSERDGTPSGDALWERGRQLWAEIKLMPELGRFLRFSGIDCSNVLERRLQHYFEQAVPGIVDTFLKALSLIRTERPFAVLDASAAWCEIRAIALAARKEGVPFVVYEHGVTGAHVLMESLLFSIYEETEIRVADYVFVYGHGDVRYLGKSKWAREGQIIPVGSAVLDETKKCLSPYRRDELHRQWGLDPEKRTVMYIPTDMDGNLRMAPYRGRSPSRMFRLEQSILNVFSEFPDIQFVVKLLYAPFSPTSPTAQLVRDNQLKNVAVITEPFLSLLPMGDMFITDYPALPLLEMLTTDRPILLCGYLQPWPWAPGKWHPSVLDMYKERIAYADGLEEFLELLRTYLREEQFQSVRSENTLLKLFGTHLDDGKSVDRAYAFLEPLAAQKSGRGN